MGHHFTPEGLRLATFKMCMENNAMLHAMFNVLSRIYTDMAMEPVLPGKEDLLEQARKSFEENAKYMATVLESLSMQRAYDFAVEHDSNLDTSLF